MDQHILSLDAEFGDDEGNSLLRVIPDEDQEPPDALLVHHSLQKNIEAALEGLEEREQEIIRLYYGLDGRRGMNLEEIGSLFGLTRERIRQIKKKALGKLRHPKRAQKLLPYHTEEI